MPKRALPLFLAFAACHGGPDLNQLPSFVVKDSISTLAYDGTSDDLLTGGLGASGLAGSGPTFANPAAPTAAELRKRAIYSSYRALVDTSFYGGYGTLYGPNVDVNGNPQFTEGKIAGEEWLAYDDDGTGRVKATMMVQVPASFDPDHPCIVAAAASGSRGVYGAIATAGEWGLKHGCAVACTDKGGSGVNDVQNDTVNVIDGTRQGSADAGTGSSFTAALSDVDRSAFNTASPNRFAVKQAHAQSNPEKDWGPYTLHAIQFAYYVLNQKFGAAQGDGGSAQITRKYHPGQVLTIAAGTGGGGGAALAAVEQDPQHYVSGVVAVSPQVQLISTSAIQRNGVAVPAKARPFYDYLTLAMLYEGCAPKAAGVTKELRDPFLPGAQIDARCNALTAKGLLTTNKQPDQANEALQILLQAGFEADATDLYASYFSTYATTAAAVTAANGYARASVKDSLCGYSFAVVDGTGVPVPLSAVPANANGLAQIFAAPFVPAGTMSPPITWSGAGNGAPPTFPLEIINNNAQGGPKRDQVSVSLSTGVQDFNIDGAACLRSLWTGLNGSGSPLAGDLLLQSSALKAGTQQVLRNGRVRGIPAILVHGRDDALVPVNHSSRAYLGAGKMAEGAGSPLYYYEVTNAQHFDAFIDALAPYQTRFVPLQRYLVQSLDLMYAHLKSGGALPPSQVVRTTPRSTPTTFLNSANVPAISPAPAPGDQITFTAGTLNVPD